MNILIASSICPDAIEKLRIRHDVLCAFGGPQEDLASIIEDREVLIFRSGVQITKELMSRAPNLKLLIRAGSGLDNLDVDYVRHRALGLVRIPEPGARAVAELTFGLMLALARQIRFADDHLRRGQWTKSEVTGYLLRAKVLGIVGAGNIGSRVGQMGTAWGMIAIGCVEHPSLAVEAALQEKGIQLTEFSKVLARADFLSIHVPLQKSTRNLIEADALSRMKQNSFLVNMARGGVVNERDLFDALVNQRQLAGAALDVHQEEGEGKVSPLASLPNVVLTPHIGASTVDTQREIGERILEIVASFIRNPFQLCRRSDLAVTNLMASSQDNPQQQIR